MDHLDEIAAQQAQFQDAVLNAQPFIPLYVKMKVFYGCNLKCEMCNHWRESREAPVPAGRFMDIIRELGEMGTRKIHISGGEPMLRPHVPDFVELAASLGIKITMTTNGTLVDKVKAKRLVEAGLRGVNISIDSPIRKVHEKIRKDYRLYRRASRGKRSYNFVACLCAST